MMRIGLEMCSASSCSKSSLQYFLLVLLNNTASSAQNLQTVSPVRMKSEVPVKIKLRFVAHDECSKSEVSKAGSRYLLDLTLKVHLRHNLFNLMT